MSGIGTFTQFSYCPLCHINHKKLREHTYSKRHQEIVTNILKKFATKILTAKASATQPAIKTPTAEDKEKMFWCYFCQKDVSLNTFKESLRGNCVISYGGMLEHISGSEHGLGADKFLKENRVKAERKAEFVMTSQGYMKFLECANTACEIFFNENAKALQKIAATIAGQTKHSERVVAAALVEKTEAASRPSSFGQSQDDVPLAGMPTDINLERKRTVRAFGDGLTPIDRTDEDDSLGNIYTNALPPWLRADQEGSGSSASGRIGPDMADWDRHKKAKKKALLRADRTGAKFDRRGEQSDSWLPAFGGVWKHGARTHSVKQFQKRQDIKGAKKSPLQFQHNSSDHFAGNASSSQTPSHHISAGKVWQPPNQIHSSSYSNELSESQTNGLTHSASFIEDSRLHPYKATTYVQNDQTERGNLTPNLWTKAGTSSACVSSSDSHVNILGVKPYVRKRRRDCSSVEAAGSNCLPYTAVSFGDRRDCSSVQPSGSNCLPYTAVSLGDRHGQITDGRSYSRIASHSSGQCQDTQISDEKDLTFSLLSTPVLHLK